MASVSSTSSLGNTSLRGYGGMASGIDRDEIIEQMTLGTTTKINNQEKDITKLEWKQEAYRGISDKILDLYDNYSSYTSPTSLKDPNTFAKNLISVLGKEEATRFITATGSSELVNSVSVQAVRQLATSSVYKSDPKKGTLETGVKELDGTFMYQSNLMYSQLRFTRKNGDSTQTQVFDLPTSYTTDETVDGETKKVTHQIDYFLKEDIDDGNGGKRMETADEYGARLAKELNQALQNSTVSFEQIGASGTTDKTDLKDAIEFVYDASSKQMKIQQKGGDMRGYEIQGSSTALEALGYKKTDGTIKVSDLENNRNTSASFQNTALTQISALDYLKGKKVTFNYDGSKKDIVLITDAEAEELKKLETDLRAKFDSEVMTEDHKKNLEAAIKTELLDTGKYIDGSAELQSAIDNQLQVKMDEEWKQYKEDNKLSKKQMDKMAQNLEKRLDRAFGTDVIEVTVNDKGNLTFDTAKKNSTLSITSTDGGILYNLGIADGASNKVNLQGTLSQSNIGINLNEQQNVQARNPDGSLQFEADGKTPVYVQAKNEDGSLKYEADGTTPVYEKENVYKDGLVINGVTIGGIDANTSISSILSKINSNEDAGVKATYVDATGQFMLVSTETGAAREITLDSKLAQDLFGGSEAGNGLVKGQDAIIDVSYGNGVTVQLNRASNTFNLEGMEVTVSGTFGGEYVEQQAKDEDGNPKVEDGKPVMEKVWQADTSEAVKFSAKADVDKVVEKVKKFFEDFNAIVTEVNTQVTTRPDSSYGPLTDEQKDEMNETSIENWEKKAKSGLLFNDSTMRSLSMDIQSVYTKLMQQTGLSYEDLKGMGITYSDNEKDGGVIAFDETAFRTAMESKPEKVSALFTGGSGMGNGLVKIVEDTFTPYATRFASRNGNSYGRLIEEAGSEKIPTSIMKNQIYKEIKNKQDLIEQLRAKLKTEQDRYISQFTTMETMINKMNSQASYLSQITA